jgi:hypothetical protein
MRREPPNPGEIAFIANDRPEAQAALKALTGRYGNAAREDAKVIVAHGGDGTMLEHDEARGAGLRHQLRDRRLPDEPSGRDRRPGPANRHGRPGGDQPARDGGEDRQRDAPTRHGHPLSTT